MGPTNRPDGIGVTEGPLRAGAQKLTLACHRRDDGLHACDRAEQVGVEQFAARRHLHVRHRVPHPYARIVDPHIDAVEMVQHQPERPVDLLPMPHVAGQGQRALRVSDSMAGGFRAARVARQHHDASSRVGKDFGNRFPNTHGSARNYHNFPFHLHADPCIAWSATESTAGVKSKPGRRREFAVASVSARSGSVARCSSALARL